MSERNGSLLVSARQLQALVRQQPLQEFAKLVDRQAGVANDAAHCMGIYGVVARHRKDSGTLDISHDDMFGLTGDPKAGFLKGAHSIQVVDTRKLGHVLGDFYFPD